MTKKLYRQGDVAIERVSEIPKNLKKTKAIKGRVILAEGEVTGHHHAFASLDAQKLVADDGSEFFHVKGRNLDCRLSIIRRWNSQVMVKHPKFGIIEFAECDVEIDGNDVVISGDFGLLTHDEHHAHGIPAGLYKGGAGKTVRQKEYTPEAIRNVAD